MYPMSDSTQASYDVFHMIYPLVFNMAQGMSPHPLTEEQKNHVRKTLRGELLAVIKTMDQI